MHGQKNIKLTLLFNCIRRSFFNTIVVTYILVTNHRPPTQKDTELDILLLIYYLFTQQLFFGRVTACVCYGHDSVTSLLTKKCHCYN
jgi:hypothetical protein